MGIAISWFTCAGYTVCIPLTDSQHYDLIVDDYLGGLQRVSVKTTTRKYESGSYIVGLRTMGGNRSQSEKVKKFNPSLVELLFIACDNGDKYLIPATSVTANSTIHLSTKYDKFKV